MYKQVYICVEYKKHLHTCGATQKFEDFERCEHSAHYEQYRNSKFILFQNEDDYILTMLMNKWLSIKMRILVHKDITNFNTPFQSNIWWYFYGSISWTFGKQCVCVWECK